MEKCKLRHASISKSGRMWIEGEREGKDIEREREGERE